MLFKNSIAEGKLVLHSCDNSECYFPDHLHEGTYKENVLDAIDRGRWIQSQRPKKYTEGRQDIIGPYDYVALLKYIKINSYISSKNEWLFKGEIPPQENWYPEIHFKIDGKFKKFLLHRLLLANKVNKKYEEIDVACHRLPDGSKPKKHDLNPDHLYEGDLRDNSYDTIKYNKGYKLNFEKANEIREAMKFTDFFVGGSKSKFDKFWATKFSVNIETIGLVRRGYYWNDRNIK